MADDGERYHGDVDEIFERISDAFFGVDEDFRFTFLNERAEQLLQASEAELLGERLWDEFPEATDTDVYRAFNEALETQKPTEFELYYEPLDFWVNARAYPSETGLSVYFRDITERKERERQLHEQRERLAVLNNVNRITRDINRAVVEQSTHAEIEELVVESLADSDSYEFAWIGTVDEDTVEVVPTAVANEACLDAVLDVTGESPFVRALRTGEPQYVQDVAERVESDKWQALGAECGLVASASVPIAYDDREYGVLNIYTERENAFDGEEEAVVSHLGEIVGLAIAGVEYEQELEHERDRLEFVNRLVRHNLLNSLNVVDARAGILQDVTGEGATKHLDVVRERTAEMTDLVEKLQSLMQVLVEPEEHELEPVDLGAILNSEIEKARQTFDDARFDVEGDLESAGVVMGDDLLAELFENVLSNAVQHNDKSEPRVVVDVEGGSELTTVRIADNGPGVPDDAKDAIFRKGEKGFSSPGTGFGLYFVKEIVDAYDGEVSVTDNDPEGAVFEISLPRE